MTFHYTIEDMLEIYPTSSDERLWYLTVKETLTRVGIAKFYHDKPNELYQSAFILKRKGRYYLLHFKEMFVLDGRVNNVTEEDISRRNGIAAMLRQWGLINVSKDVSSVSNIFVLPFYKKQSWRLVQKYPIGYKHHMAYHENIRKLNHLE